MKLGEMLKKLPPRKKIRIGTRPGGKFIYIGTVKDFDVKKVWKKCERYFIDTIIRQTMYFKTNHKDLEGPLTNAVRKYCGMEWLPDREVLEYYPGQYEPDALIIIIPGEEALVDYDHEVNPMTSEGLTEYGCQILVDAIYQGVAKELVASKVTASRNTEARTARKDARNLEKWFKQDPYHILDDPAGVVNACRKQSKEIVEGRKTLKRKDRKVWDY